MNPYPYRIGYQTPVLFCGSCFSENIGKIMVDLKMPVRVNPFGVVYNPVSVKQSLDRLLHPVQFVEADLHYGNGLWFSLMHHTSFSSPDRGQCLSAINQSLIESANFLQRARFLLVTFGTARVYYLRETQQPVSNCHKIPAREFEHRLLSIHEIVEEWIPLLNELKSTIPDIKVIFTVSPVRHWKDGAEGNQQSKATLILAIHELVSRVPEMATYFPAYEIVMDDLRDYRFYADDMLHPSPLAVKYIWEKFSNAILDTEAIGLVKQVERVKRALNHRPFNPETREHQDFLRNTLAQIVLIRKKYPQIDFAAEERQIMERLA